MKIKDLTVGADYLYARNQDWYLYRSGQTRVRVLDTSPGWGRSKHVSVASKSWTAETQFGTLVLPPWITVWKGSTRVTGVLVERLNDDGTQKQNPEQEYDVVALTLLKDTWEKGQTYTDRCIAEADLARQVKDEREQERKERMAQIEARFEVHGIEAYPAIGGGIRINITQAEALLDRLDAQVP